MDKSKSTLACPFCGDKHVTVSGYDTKAAWWTQCDNIHCGAEGPTRRTAEEARSAWNVRAGGLARGARTGRGSLHGVARSAPDYQTVKRELKAFCDVARKVMDAVDAEMAKPSDNERGKRVAKIMNALNFQYDSARHFGLGESLRSDKRLRRPSDDSATNR